MSLREQLILSEVDEGEPFGTAARVLLPNGAAMQIADVSTWDLRVYDVTFTDSDLNRLVYDQLAVDPTVDNTNPVPGAPLYISDTLRKDGYWPKAGASPGYNVLHFATAAEWAAHRLDFKPIGGRTYLKLFTFELAGGWGVKILKHRLKVGSVRYT